MGDDGEMLMVDLERFKREFEFDVLRIPGVERVVFAGSIGRGTFVPGKSDADILVFGDVGLQDRIRIYEILWRLNQRFGLQLERAPLPHPPVVFVDTAVERYIVDQVRAAKGSEIADDLRAFLKRVAPTAGLPMRVFAKIRRLGP